MLQSKPLQFVSSRTLLFQRYSFTIRLVPDLMQVTGIGKLTCSVHVDCETGENFLKCCVDLVSNVRIAHSPCWLIPPPWEVAALTFYTHRFEFKSLVYLLSSCVSSSVLVMH